MTDTNLLTRSKLDLASRACESNANGAWSDTDDEANRLLGSLPSIRLLLS
jgi:hypothetical protein